MTLLLGMLHGPNVVPQHHDSPLISYTELPPISGKLFAAFLYGQNIPGRKYLSALDVEKVLRPLIPRICLLKIVTRPDSILLSCDSSETDQSIREALYALFGCKSVVIGIESLRRIVKAAQSALQSIGQPACSPYRLNCEDAEWEWCVVLCSESLPLRITEQRCFGTPSAEKVVPIGILDSRALLARKRRLNPSGTRIMTGAVLIKPWEQALHAQGIIPNCLTSRVLNQVEKVLLAAEKRFAGEKIVPTWCQNTA
jgi:hypothetical protein